MRAPPRRVRPRSRSAMRFRGSVVDLGPHGGYILAAYAFAAIVIGGLILNALRDNHAQRRALADLQNEAGRDRP